jgi:hypothetical protein
VGICGEAPATYPEVAAFLTELGVNSISVNPQSLGRTLEVVRQAEAAAGLKPTPFFPVDAEGSRSPSALEKSPC